MGAELYGTSLLEGSWESSEVKKDEERKRVIGLRAQPRCSVVEKARSRSLVLTRCYITYIHL